MSPFVQAILIYALYAICGFGLIFLAIQALNHKIFKHQLKIQQPSKITLTLAIQLSVLLLLVIFNYSITSLFPQLDIVTLSILKRFLNVLSLIFFYFLIKTILNLVLATYNKYPIAKKRPLNAIFQAINIVLLVLLTFGLIAVFVNKDPLLVMGSISTLVAFISFIFKEILLGFFASIQLTSTETLHIGDFIEVKTLNLSGTVDSINLTTVTLAQTNQSIITVPAYSLISHPLTNFRHLYKTQGRLFQKQFYFNNPLSKQDDIDQFIQTIEQFFTQNTQINPAHPYFVVLESVELYQLVFNIRCYTLIKDFIEFNQFSSDLSRYILSVAQQNHLIQQNFAIIDSRNKGD